MSQTIKRAAIALVLTLILTSVVSSAAFAGEHDGSDDPDRPGIGPAPSAGDGESEGPEWDIPIPNGPNG